MHDFALWIAAALGWGMAACGTHSYLAGRMFFKCKAVNWLYNLSCFEFTRMLTDY
jgi:hypothetical protein